MCGCLDNNMVINLMLQIYNNLAMEIKECQTFKNV